MNTKQVAELQQDVEAVFESLYKPKGGNWVIEPLKLGGAGIEINIGSQSMQMDMHEALIALAKKHNTSYSTEADIGETGPDFGTGAEEIALQYIYMESLENNSMLTVD